MKTILPIFLLVFVCLSAAPLPAESIFVPPMQVSGLRLELFALRLKEDPVAETPSSLTVKMRISNVSATRKLDFDSRFQAGLEDEFGNRYRLLEDRAPYPESLYPGEDFVLIYRFEPPVSSSERMVLSLTSPLINGGEPARIHFPSSKIEGRPPAAALRPLAAEDMTIELPKPGIELQPGQRFILQVRFSDDLPPPQNVIINSPDFGFNDDSAAGRYLLQVPEEQPGGEYTYLIIARWGDAPSMSLSRDIQVSVKPVPAPGCPEHCPEPVQPRNTEGSDVHALPKTDAPASPGEQFGEKFLDSSAPVHQI